MIRSVKCPTCRAETAWENNPHRPFCSERCKLVDLGAWMQEKHRVPGERVDFGWETEDDDDGQR
jgi:endogenous inhibitor of DNA gyrase (YacG/DUF329 family)